MTTTAKRFQVPGGPTLAYDEAGDATAAPVVVLHGVTGGRREWEWFGVTAKLATEHRVLVLDQRGHGDSDRAPGTYRLSDYAADLVAFLENVVGAPAALVGHSLGGLVSAQVAADRPELVLHAIFEDAPVYWTTEVWMEAVRNGEFDQFQLLAQLLRVHHDQQGTVEQLADLIGMMPSPLGAGTIAEWLGVEGTLAYASCLHGFDPDAIPPALEGSFLDGFDRTRPIHCPVHALRADPARDSRFFAEHEAPFLATHPRATVELVEGAGHLIHIEQTERFLTSALGFLEVS